MPPGIAMDDVIKDCTQAARLAATILLDMQGKINAREKAPADLVTEADLASQQAIFEYLLVRYPDYGFVGEEPFEPAAARPTSDYCWIVDPLDGTTNYVHGLDNFSVSIALRRSDRVLAGVVLDPVRNELFWAKAGEGAFLNGRRLKASEIVSVGEALVAASFSARVHRDSPEIRRFIEVVCECQAVRRMGSAALNLCYVAAGKLDGYWASSVKSWDVAAGILMVQEAGGVVSGLNGGPFDLNLPALVVAGTPLLHRELLGLLERAEPHRAERFAPESVRSEGPEASKN
jgi:myo-inositol-1(or 4)-monophosphatase